MTSLADYLARQNTEGYTSGHYGLTSISHTTDEAKTHLRHVPYKNDFKTAYERVLEEKDDKWREVSADN